MSIRLCLDCHWELERQGSRRDSGLIGIYDHDWTVSVKADPIYSKIPVSFIQGMLNIN